MIGDKEDIHCSVCGRYLFTQKYVPDHKNPNSVFGIIVFENDHEDYTWRCKTDDFICNQCSKRGQINEDVNGIKTEFYNYVKEKTFR